MYISLRDFILNLPEPSFAVMQKVNEAREAAQKKKVLKRPHNGSRNRR